MSELPVLTLETALRLVSGALEAAEAQGHPISVAVVDANGDLKAMARMEGVNEDTVRMAKEKAYTAWAVKVPTEDFVKFVLGDEVLRLVMPAQPGMTLLPGGVPIMSGTHVVGGLGVSGAPHYSLDVAIGSSAIASASA